MGPEPAPHPDVPPEGIDEARRQIGDNLAAWAELVYGRQASPDRDRLLAFAVAVSQDDELLGAHLANRLYRRRRELVLSVGEWNLWLRTLCVDAARAPDDINGRVIPGWSFFAEHRGDALLSVALSSSGQAAAGATRLLLELGERPEQLWPPSGDGVAAHGDTPSLDEAAARWVTLLSHDETRANSVNYLYLLSSPKDEALFDALDRAIGESPWGRDALAVIAARRGDPTGAVAVASGYPYSLADWAAKATIAALRKLNPIELTALVDPRQRCEPLRVAAFDRLLTSGADHSDVTTGAASMLRASETSRSHLLALLPDNALLRTSVIAAWDGLSKEDRRSDLEERLLAATESTETLVAQLVPGLSGLTVWEALGRQAPPALAEHAREVLRTGGTEFLAPEEVLGDPDDPQAQSVRSFILGKAREAALRIVAALPNADITQEDRELVRGEVTNGNWVSRDQAVLTLAKIGERKDADDLLDLIRSGELSRIHLPQAITAAYRLGGRQVAATLVDSERTEVAAGAAQIIVSDAATTDDGLIDLLYHPNADVRRLALVESLRRLDGDAVEKLLYEYPRRDGPHYYNVIVGLDWHLFAKPGS